MKRRKRHTDTFGTTLEQIERVIEQIEADKPVHVSEITGKLKPALRTEPVRKATCMLLKKYGITYLGD